MRRCDPKSELSREIAGSPGQRRQVEAWDEFNPAEHDRPATPHP
jgi:hypothetical protein